MYGWADIWARSGCTGGLIYELGMRYSGLIYGLGVGVRVG